MDQGWGLSDELWSEIDAHIFGCRRLAACQLVREMIESGPEQATHIVLQRYHFLRAKRSGDFAWKDFPCGEYIASHWADHGCWSDPFTQIIVPASEVSLREDLDFLVVGGPGTDGIVWGYRKGHPGVWEYIPADAEFNLRAGTMEDLVVNVFLNEGDENFPPR